MNMKYLVDRGAVWRELIQTHPMGFDNDDIAEAFKNAPTVDAVEVVRCKDCRLSRPVHREDGSVSEGILHCFTGRGYQQNVFGREYSVISPNSFCGAGKRKMDAEVG